MSFPWFRFLLLASMVSLLSAGVVEELIRLSQHPLPTDKWEWALLGFAVLIVLASLWSHGGHIWHALKELWSKPMLVAAVFTLYVAAMTAYCLFFWSFNDPTPRIASVVIFLGGLVYGIDVCERLLLFFTDRKKWRQDRAARRAEKARVRGSVSSMSPEQRYGWK